MPNIQRPRPRWARLIPAGAALAASAGMLSPALAQDYRPDAEGYPCEARSKLAVVDDGSGFAIRPMHAPAATNPLPESVRLIAIGASLKVDPQIFARAPSRKEVTHAPHR